MLEIQPFVHHQLTALLYDFVIVLIDDLVIEQEFVKHNYKEK
jgi:hypothetical protein